METDPRTGSCRFDFDCGNWTVGTDGYGCLCRIALPMGWASAVGVMQAILCRLTTMPPPIGAGLPTAEEIRKTSIFSTSGGQRLWQAWQVYLDNLAMYQIEKRGEICELENAISDWHRAAREAWAKWGIPSA